MRGKRLILALCFLAMSVCATQKPLWPWFVVAATTAAGLVLLSSHREDLSAKEVLAFAILFRLILLPLLPSLSDDGFRYVWDGVLQTGGINPYLLRPDDPSLDALHGLYVYSHLNSAHYFSVYPPLSQFIYRLSAWIFPNDWKWCFILVKLIVTGVEVGGVFLLATLVEPRKLVLYAWNPLVIVETAGQGHGEGIVAALLVATLWAVAKGKPKTAVAAVTGAVWVKLYPALLLPFVLRRTNWRYLWIPVALSAVVLWPFVAPGVLDNVDSSLALYFQLFEFNAGPYFALKWLGYLTVGIVGLERVLGPILMIAFLALVANLYLDDGRKRRELSGVMSFVLGGCLVFATTIHPWYLVPIIALVPFMNFGAIGWLWFAATSTATYLFYSNGIYWPFVWMGWTGLAVVGLWHWLPRSSFVGRFVDAKLRERAVEKARRVRPFLPEARATCRILDLGAGEGYVGEHLHNTLGFRDPRSGFEIPGCEVTLCDVRNANRTALPYTVYYGGRLPFDNDSFDATLLIFVLHHAQSPERVIREARRVTGRRVIIIESVYEGMFNRLLLRFLDRIVNRIRSHGEMAKQEQYLRLRTTEEWLDMIERDGGVIQSVRQWGRFHKQVLFVIDSEVSGPRREFMLQSVGRGF